MSTVQARSTHGAGAVHLRRPSLSFGTVATHLLVPIRLWADIWALSLLVLVYFAWSVLCVWNGDRFSFLVASRVLGGGNGVLSRVSSFLGRIVVPRIACFSGWRLRVWSY